MEKFELGEINKPVEGGEMPPIAKPVDIKVTKTLEPKIEWDDENIAEITSEPMDSPNVDWDSILKQWGYDPETHEIIEPVKVTQWDTVIDGEVKQLWSYKASVVTKPEVLKKYQYSDLVADIKKYKRSTKDWPETDDFFLVNLADWQTGKPDGYGTAGTVKAILQMIDNVEVRIKELRKLGRSLGTLVVAGMGDMIENCEGSYAAQTFGVELNRREQLRICRRLVRDAIIRWSKLFARVWVTAVPGNHGENKNGSRRIFTTTGDNDDVGVFEQVGDILSLNPSAFGHVEFFLPEDEIFTLLPMGINVGFAHGHITGGSGTPSQKIRNWWSDQTFNKRPLKDADLLITAHYHHLSIREYSEGAVHIQCPSMDGGSKWWEDLKGEHSRPGTLTMVVDKYGYRDLQII